MTKTNARWTLIFSIALTGILTVPSLGNAQEISVSGTVSDATGGVLPGVVLTAVHVDSGNSFVAVTESTGQYRFGSIRPGIYNITAELAGFATTTQEQLELLVGQRAVLDFSLTISDLQESVTVSAASPLLDLQQSKLGGNIDARQVESLPINGRNWQQLALLAPGARVNAIGKGPLGSTAGNFQYNIDGQQVTNTMALTNAGSQARFSRDAIAEFEVITSRFDATQGRSLAQQVNAVSKSGTNFWAGMVSGYFRDDRFNAKDPVVDRVLPYSNQQFSTTFGGPIVTDKAHFFVNYEGEREPVSLPFNGPFPAFNIPDMQINRTNHMAGARVDVQLNSNTRLLVRGNTWSGNIPAGGGALTHLPATYHPSTLVSLKNRTGQVFGSLIRASGRTINELQVGVSFIHDDQVGIPLLGNTPTPYIIFRGYRIGTPSFVPLLQHQNVYSIRDDFTFLRGDHAMKLGGEFLLPVNWVYWESSSRGLLLAVGGPPPENIETLFPVWNDPSTWNLAALSPLTIRYSQSVGNFEPHCAKTLDESDCRRKKPQYGMWFQDDWAVGSQLTLNLGVRWDFALDGNSNDIEVPPFKGIQPQEWLNFGPRLGFAYSLPGNRTVIRGGWGKYFASSNDWENFPTEANLTLIRIDLLNDGRPDFAADPFNGPLPTFEEAQRLGLTRELTNVRLGKTPYSYQTTVGIQQQLGESMAFQADYVWIAGKRLPSIYNINLSYDPATGLNFPFTDLSKRPFPEFGRVAMKYDGSHSNYHALQTAFSKRFGDNWQASATYTLSGTWDFIPLPLKDGCAGPINGNLLPAIVCDTPFELPNDLGGDYSLSAFRGTGFTSADQRHRAVVNGIWELPYGVQLSGLYFFGSGERWHTFYSGDLRNNGGSAGTQIADGRLRPDGTIGPRNNLVGEPLHRVDLGIRYRMHLGGASTLDGIVQIFNVFNHKNFGSYVPDEASPSFGQPVALLDVEYQPRIMQLGFRFAF